MIRIFRNLRKRLIADSSVSKYLWYAVGEIFLVVFGILIALQINNWNQDRQNRNYERKILTQIKINLEKDKSALQGFVRNGMEAMYSTRQILSLSRDTTHDSIRYWLADVIRFDRFQPLTNGYEALKSKGLELITDQELGFLLGTYYDDRAKFIAKAVEDVEWSFMNEWLPIIKQHVLEFKFGSHVNLDDDQLFLRPGLPRNTLVMNEDNWSGSIQYMQDGISLIGDILTLIDGDLGKVK